MHLRPKRGNDWIKPQSITAYAYFILPICTEACKKKWARHWTTGKVGTTAFFMSEMDWAAEVKSISLPPCNLRHRGFAQAHRNIDQRLITIYLNPPQRIFSQRPSQIICPSTRDLGCPIFLWKFICFDKKRLVQQLISKSSVCWKKRNQESFFKKKWTFWVIWVQKIFPNKPSPPK